MSTVNNDGDSKPPGHSIPYSLPGIICFLQHEWTKMEAERQLWAVQRAEYEAKISVLNGEVLGLQNLKTVLIRRIKMLEWALKQESVFRFKAGGQPPNDSSSTEQGQEPAKEDVQLFTPSPSSYTIRRGKLLMKKFLEEMGNMDNLLDLRCDRARFSIMEKYRRQLLTSDQVLQASQSSPYRTSAQDAERVLGETNQEEAASRALEQFEFLENAEFGEDDSGTSWIKNCDVNENASTSWPSSVGNKQLAGYSKPTCVNAVHPDRLSSCMQNGSFDEAEARYIDEQIVYMSRNERPLPAPAKKALVEHADRPVEDRATLHGHLDVVRCLAIHKSAPLLITGSDDHTVKLWDISDPVNRSSFVSDVTDPIETIRKHTTCVSAVCIGPKQNWFFTADISGVMYLWSIVSLNPEDWKEQDLLVDNLARLGGQKDCVSCIETVPSMDILMTSCADNTLRMWFVDKCDAGNVVAANPIGTKEYGTAVRFISILDDRDALVAFDRGSIALWNLVKQGLACLVCADSGNVPDDVQITDISLSPEPAGDLVVAAYTDGYVRWFDLKTGALYRSMMAHHSVITAVHASSNFLLTTAHDGILRLWLMNPPGEFVCKQEQVIHRRKADEAIVSMACRIPFFATAGADSICRLFFLGGAPGHGSLW